MSAEEQKEICKLSMDYWMQKCVKVNYDPLKEAIMKGPEEFFERMHKEQDRRLEFALRHLIPHPIKGKITKGKLKWRGIYLMIPPLETPKLEKKEDGNYILRCTFLFPILCCNQSRSGKRQHYEINLNFCPEHMAQYQFVQSQDYAHIFGVSSRQDGKYKVGGILNQITKGDNHE